MKNELDEARPDEPASARFRLRLPGFVADHEIGLGDAVRRGTAWAGIPTCGACAERAAVLDRWIALVPWRRTP